MKVHITVKELNKKEERVLSSIIVAINKMRAFGDSQFNIFRTLNLRQIYISGINLDHCATSDSSMSFLYPRLCVRRGFYGVVSTFWRAGRTEPVFLRAVLPLRFVGSQHTVPSTPSMEGAVLRSFADGFEGVRYMSGINKKEKEENREKGKT